MKVETVRKFFKDPGAALQMLSHAGLLFWLPDKTFLKLVYRVTFHRKLNLKDPKTYREKTQWLKLYHRDPLYTLLSDKYAMRDYTAQKLGEGYTVPLLGVWDRFEDIDFDKLPDRFVLKCTHDSGSTTICSDKASFNRKKAGAHFKKCLRRNFYLMSREWGYKNIRPRIIAEQYLADDSGCGIKDYKFTCMNGEPKYLFVCQNRGGEGGLQVDAYDMQLRHLPLKEENFKNSPKPFSKPESFDRMLEICKTLAEPFPLIRIDLYEVHGKVYLGEFTFYPTGGLHKFNPEEWDEIFGSGITLPEKD